MRTEDAPMIRLEDYRPSAFRIPHMDLLVRLFEGHAEVEARFQVERATESNVPDLVLDGEELELAGLALDGEELGPDRYELAPDGLLLRQVPLDRPFSLTVRTRLRPEENTTLMGLYRSRGVWTTQCEAEGFRRIAFSLDRPDVLSTYRVRLEADRDAAPVLLANGNPVEHGDLNGGRHYAIWDDPHPKPSYLFALVAGDLDVLRDSFRTASGADVALAIYTERGLAPRAAYAMDALKRSMRWDERRFGREYDLDVFNIVAVSDFNMGAMENKGLNIFNHKYVLLDPETATDADYAGVETVIAHEYFHNWTGNRITCRDWFQLCLKEGLTVYRDQEFTSDERSATVKRIASVRSLRAHQFPEDQGPLQHAVRPTRYREISNFYTATVYDKGAEVVRMLATILGPAGFREGMDLYFRRHDGEATTIEAFLACFAETSGRDLRQFALWYTQAGTPVLDVAEHHDPASGRYEITFTQSLASGAAGTGTAPMHLPVRAALLNGEGREIAATIAEATGAAFEQGVIHFTAREARIGFEGVSERPLLSILRDFSAPVELRFNQSEADRLRLAAADPDPYGRWSALAGLAETVLVEGARERFDAARARPVMEAMAAAADDGTLEPALRSLMVALPPESEIARLVGEDVDPGRVHSARLAAMGKLGAIGADRFRRLRRDLHEADFSPSAESAGRRALRNTVLAYLALANGSPSEAAEQFRTAANMTDRFEALTVLAHLFREEAATADALSHFFERFEHDDLVLDKWFMLQASAPHDRAVEAVEELSRHPAFRLSNPNRARALLGGFANANPFAFHRADGAGYRFFTRQLLALDRLNPQTAARLATTFRTWRTLEAGRRTAIEMAMREMQAEPLSKDLKDIIDRTLL